ncbi:MAG: hypothetical protein AAFX99_03055, partial [Myxococcota bacterium]
LDALLSSGALPKKDQPALRGLKAVLVELAQQAKLLMDYSADKKPQTAQAFRDLRAKTWASIVRLLGLGDSGSRLEPGGATLGQKNKRKGKKNRYTYPK